MSDVVQVRVLRLPHAEGLPLPGYTTAGAAGMDVHAAVAESLTIEPGRAALVPTGLVLEMPPGHEAQIRPRSGLALRHMISVLNSPGTIDSDYRGELQIILANLGPAAFTVQRGDRIAQMVIARVERAELTVVGSLTGTARGEGGFGHSGV